MDPGAMIRGASRPLNPLPIVIYVHRSFSRVESIAIRNPTHCANRVFGTATGFIRRRSLGGEGGAMRIVKFLPRWIIPHVESEQYEPPPEDPAARNMVRLLAFAADPEPLAILVPQIGIIRTKDNVRRSDGLTCARGIGRTRFLGHSGSRPS
jgi:hypothetical protein